MNNTKTTLAAIAAILIAATLVVGGTFAATTTHPAFAYSKNKVEGDKNSKNGNTITIQKCEQKASQSGFDNDQEQECANLICTHPGSNATCVSEEEGAVVTPTSTSTSTSGPPAPIPPSSTISCVAPLGNCCFVINTGTTTGSTDGGATTGGAQSGTTTCSVTVTCTGGAGGAGTPGGDANCANVPPTGSLISTSAIAMKSSENEKCVNGASASLNTGTGRTFAVCVNV